MRYEQLCDNVDDANFVRTECGGELRAVELAGFAIFLVKNCLAGPAKRSRLTRHEEMREVFPRRAIFVEDDRVAFATGTKSDLDVGDRG
jgi:hypothetical protein